MTKDSNNPAPEGASIGESARIDDAGSTATRSDATQDEPEQKDRTEGVLPGEVRSSGRRPLFGR